MDAIVVTPNNYDDIVAWAPPGTIRTRDVKGGWIIGTYVWTMGTCCDELAEFGDRLVKADGHVLVLPSQEETA